MIRVSRPCAERGVQLPSRKKSHDVDHVIHVKKTERRQRATRLKSKEYNTKKVQSPSHWHPEVRATGSKSLQVLASECESLNFDQIFWITVLAKEEKKEGVGGGRRQLYLDRTLAATFFFAKAAYTIRVFCRPSVQ